MLSVGKSLRAGNDREIVNHGLSPETADTSKH